MIRTLGRILLGLFLGFAGVAHFADTESFLAQVPPWLPAPEAIVWISGVIELTLAAALLFAPVAHRPAVGWTVAGFFVAIFPGNVSQFVTGTPAFGLDSDGARAVRLLFQPVLVAWALWATGAWRAWRGRSA
ncbi:MAG: DoxX family protein [Nocardioides sp.]